MHTHSTTYDGSFCCNTAFLQQYSTNPFACVTRDVPSGGAIAAGLCRTKGAASLGGYNTQSGPARLQRLLRLGAPDLLQRARVHGRGAEAGPARSRTTSPRSTSSRSPCPQRATAAGACRTSSPRSREASPAPPGAIATTWVAMRPIGSGSRPPPATSTTRGRISARRPPGTPSHRASSTTILFPTNQQTVGRAFFLLGSSAATSPRWTSYLCHR